MELIFKMKILYNYCGNVPSLEWLEIAKNFTGNAFERTCLTSPILFTLTNLKLVSDG